MEEQLILHPGLKAIVEAPGCFQVGPSRTYAYHLIYRLIDGNAHIIAVAHPSRHPTYWRRRKI